MDAAGTNCRRQSGRPLACRKNRRRVLCGQRSRGSECRGWRHAATRRHFAPLIRDQAGRLAFGEPLFDILRTYLGKKTGPMRGRDGNVHRGRPHEGTYPMISHLGAAVSLVTGALMAKRMRGETGFVGATSIGDGGSSTG